MSHRSKVMQLATQAAKRFNREYIGTEHILLGLVEEGSAIPANVFKKLGVELRSIRFEVEKIVQYGPGKQVAPGRLPFTPEVKKAIDYTIEEARSLSHNYVGPGRLLLALTRDEDGLAARILIEMGLKLEDVREEVKRQING